MPAPLRFRVWHDGAMHFPTVFRFDLVPAPNGGFRSAPEFAGGRLTAPGSVSVCIEEAGALLYPDDTTVVMQSTGLEDADGREIWEDDVVAWPDGSISVVEWVTDEDEGTAGFDVLNVPRLGGANAGRVVGNVHENPEYAP